MLSQLQAVHKKLSAAPPNKVKAQDWIELENRYHLLLNINPLDPRPIFALGTLMMQMDKPGLAINLLHRAMACGAIGASPWLNMAAAWKVEHKDADAKACYLKAIEEGEKVPIRDGTGKPVELLSAYHGLASLYINAGTPDECIKWADKALAIEPNERFAGWNKALALLEKGEWAAGFDGYDKFGFIASDLRPMERKLKTYGLPMWDGTPGKTVVITGEQGIGDEVMFASIIPDLLKQCKVIIDCDKRLVNLFKRAFPDAEAVYGTSGIDEPTPWLADHKAEACCPMGSLGRFYRRGVGDFPKTRFLTADPAKADRWRAELSSFDGLKVGISWAGGLKKTRFDQRTIVLDEWKDVLQTPGISWFSLQYHDWSPDQAALFGDKFGVPIHHWHDMIKNYDDTAAFISELDLVITVNTSLHHLAGALGVRQWCLCPKFIAWRYGISGPSPWYGNCRMLRQKEAGKWAPVMTVVKRKLDRILKQPMREAA